MHETIRFIPRVTLNAKANLKEFVELVRNRFLALQACNSFEDDAWNFEKLGAKGVTANYLYFSQLGVSPGKYFSKGSRHKNTPAQIPKELLLREPFCGFAKAMLIYLHAWETTVALQARLVPLRLLESALQEINDSTCPTATTPEVLNRACGIALDSYSGFSPYGYGKQLEMIYRYMVDLGLVAVPSDWICPLREPERTRSRVGKQFDKERQEKLPAPQTLEALADIFNSDSEDSREIFTSSACALMLCSPDRSVELLFAPYDVLAPDWIDPDTGEVGIGLRWYPAKGAAPAIKTVIPSMRDIAIRAVDRLRRLSDPARVLARWYEENPQRIYLPPHLEYLRGRERLDTREMHAVLFGGEVATLTNAERNRLILWLNALGTPRVLTKNKVTVAFADLERGVLAKLPVGFPIMDSKTGLRYSDALCIARLGECSTTSTLPSQCCFSGIKYHVLYGALKSTKTVKSVFEQRGYRDENGEVLFMTSHMLRHYLNTLVRQSGKLTENEIAHWSGRKNVRQNGVYNHQSDRDLIAKLRDAVGDTSKAVGPFANIDDRIFIRREEFANLKVITAHTTEFGYCIHDYAQSPCQVHQDCIHCNEQVCIKGDARAEQNLRSLQKELIRLQDEAQIAFSDEVLGSADWFKYQAKTLERVNELIAILDRPDVHLGSAIQLGGVVPPSRIAMAQETRALKTRSYSQKITSLDDVRLLLTDKSTSLLETTDAV